MQEFLAAATASSFISKLETEIFSPIITVLTTVSILYFLYGLYEFITGGDIKKLDLAKKHMLWGLIGLFIIVASRGIIGVIQNTVNTLTK